MEASESRNYHQEKIDSLTKIKRALKAAGFNPLSVHYGRGTGSNWIDVTIEGYPKYYRNGDSPEECQKFDELRARAFSIVKHESGRDRLEDDIQTDLFMVNILLDVQTAEQYRRNHPIKPKKPESEKRKVDTTGLKLVKNCYNQPLEKYYARPGPVAIEGYGTADYIVHGPAADFYLHKSRTTPGLYMVSCSSSNLKRRMCNSTVRGITWFKEVLPGELIAWR
jgi:hypothetical protein